jgi:hypothetical protein
MKKSPISVKYFPTATFRKRRYDQYPSIVHFPDEKTIEENQQDLKEQYGEKKDYAVAFATGANTGATISGTTETLASGIDSKLGAVVSGATETLASGIDSKLGAVVSGATETLASGIDSNSGAVVLGTTDTPADGIDPNSGAVVFGMTLTSTGGIDSKVAATGPVGLATVAFVSASASGAMTKQTIIKTIIFTKRSIN